MKVQQELDETKIILVRLTRRTVAHSELTARVYGAQHKTIESVLQRGEKINDLVDRSNELSMQSKMFYKTAKKVRGLLLLSFRESALTGSLFSKTPAVLSCREEL